MAPNHKFFPPPLAANVLDSVQEVRRSVVSRTKFSNKSSLDRIDRYLRVIGAMGKLTVTYSQGGKNIVSFEAEQSLNGSDRVEIQFTES